MSDEIIDSTIVDGVVQADEGIRVADIVLTSLELQKIVCTLNWACQYANPESIADIVPIVDKIKAMVAPR